MSRNRLLTISITVLLFVTPVLVQGNGVKITKNRAEEIANNEAVKLGYDVKTMVMKASHYNTPSNEYLPVENNEDYYADIRDKLKNKEYWAIYFRPDPEKVGKGHKGGDLCVFLDASSGEILAVLRGK